jgi:pyruvate dehydrogenase E2 component (dihydrolipoamide acetyltransferase)
MPIQITMPRLSDTMQQGTVVRWAIKEGQKVATGDTIADIETDKATMELQSYDDGTVASLAVKEGQTVPVGTVIAVLAGQGESVDAARKGGGAAAGAAGVTSSSGGAKAAEAQKKQAGGGSGIDFSERDDVGTATLSRGGERQAGRDQQPGRAPAVETPEPRGDRVFVSPLARKMAEEAGLDLSEIKGTGPAGRIVRKDIEDAMKGGVGRSPLRADKAGPEARHPQIQLPSPGAALQGRRVALSNMRRVIARRLVESKQSIPHYQVTVEADVGPLLSLRQQLNEQLASQGVKLSVNDFLVRACALAMHQHPWVNSRWVEDASEAAIEILPEVNIGVAIALPEERGGGLVVATLRQADRAGLRQISSEAKRLADKARSKGLSIEEMDGSTFTISNLGMYGVEHFTAIINPPNVAILAVGGAIQKPVVKDGQVVIGHRMAMTMSSDHRVVDGAMAAQYLATVKQMLETPATLLV